MSQTVFFTNYNALMAKTLNNIIAYILWTNRVCNSTGSKEMTLIVYTNSCITELDVINLDSDDITDQLFHFVVELNHSHYDKANTSAVISQHISNLAPS